VNNSRITFIGAGNMASAIIGGLLKQGVAAERICATDPSEEKRQQLKEALGIQVEADNQLAVKAADAVVLCVKPQILQQVCEGLSAALAHKPLIISIAAGIEMSAIETWLGGELPLVRCMPNTPAQVLKGASGLIANALVAEQQKELAAKLFSAVGVTEWLDDEALIHGVTALSGSGPAYIFLVIEAMEQAAIKQGIDATTARKFAAQTVLGAAEMVLASDLAPSQLKRNVMSPGGTTERAIQVLESQGLLDIFDQAIDAAAKRSVELSLELSETLKG